MKKYHFTQSEFSFMRQHFTTLQKSVRKIVAFVLSVCMMTTMLPVAAFAEDEILGPKQAPVAVSAPSIPTAPPAPDSTPTAPPAPTQPEQVPPSAPPEAPSTPTPPPAPEAPSTPAAPPAPTAPSTPAASNSTDAASSSASASGAETLVPESEPPAPTDSDITQQSPTPRAAETVYHIGAADPSDVTATLSADKTTLTITGTGAMMDWSIGDDMPWYPAVTTIQTVKIDDGVTNIGDIAFYNCTALTSVTIGTGVKNIGANAFRNCDALPSVTIPDSVKDIENYAFGYCSLLSSVTISANATNIGAFAFQCCNALTSLDIPASVVTIGKFAFSYCEKLANVTMNFSDDSDKNAKNIGASAFEASPITTTSVVAENTTPKFKKWSSKSTAGTVAEFTDVNAASTTLTNVPNSCTITAEYEPMVTSVTVEPATVTVQKGGTRQFTATVTGIGDPAQTVTWTVTGDKAGTSITDGLLSVAADETAARLTVTATSTVDTTQKGTATVKVAKKAATLTINSVAAKTYDGTAIKDPTDITSNVTAPTVTYAYYQDANGTKGTQLTSAPTDAGTYWVDGTIAATADTAAVTSEAVKFAITPKALSSASVTVNGTYTYNGKAQVPTAADMIVQDGTTTIAADYSVNASNNTNAGTATVSVVFKNNYSGTASKNFTIGKATPTVTLTATPNSATYGTQITLTVTTGGVNNEKPNGSAVLKDNGTVKQTITITNTNGTATCSSANDTVDTHLVTAEFTATDANYTTAAVKSSASYTITKADQAELAFDPGEKTYGDAAFTLAATDGSGDGAITYTSADATVISINGTQATIHKAGNVRLTATKAGGENYYEKKKEVTVTVNPATPTFTWTQPTQKVTYTGNAALITAPTVVGVTGDVPSGAVTYAHKLTSASTYTDGLPTNAGIYNVKAKIAAAGNYKAAESADMTLTVEKANLTVTGGTVAAKKWDNTTDATVTALTFGGLVNKETLTPGKDYSVGSPKFDSAAVGSTKTVTGTASLLSTSRAGNYTLADGKYSIPNCTIGKKPQITNIDEFVEQMYEKILGRSSDAAGHKAWVDGLTNKTISGASCVYSFAFGAEYTSKNISDDDFVTMLYAAFFGREPDTAGYKTWTKTLGNGMSREWVFAQFVSSPEFSATCKALGIEVGAYKAQDPRDENINATDFINRLYRTCLNRKGEKDGVNAWVNVLNKKTQSPKQIAHGFVFSKEFIAKNYSNTDFVKQLYRALMGREFDTAGLAAWVKTLDTGTMTREQVFNGFVNSPEFAAIIRSFGL